MSDKDNKIKYNDSKTANKIIKTYARIARNNDIVRMVDLIDAGVTRDQIKHYFKNLSRLNQVTREKYPDSFFDVYLTTQLTQENINQLNMAVRSHKRFIITTAVTGCRAHPDMIAAIENYCQANDAHALILVASDPAHNLFSPGTRYGTIDSRLLNSPHMSLVVSDISLNSNLFISTVKLSAKHVDPATSMGRIASKKGTFIFASPKQRLKAVPISNKKIPHFVMTTGAITIPNYSTNNYMSGRSAFIAEHDHIMGALIVEIENKKIYHFRQLQLDDDGSFIDLGKQYLPDGSITDAITEALVLGDWHSGETCPTTKKAIAQIATLLNPQRIILHDLFNGTSINHHELNNVDQRAKNAIDSTMLLNKELHLVSKDLKYLLELADQLVVVRSNHDEFLDRFLVKGDFSSDHHNYETLLELALFKVRHRQNVLKYGVEQYGILSDEEKKHIIWLDRDEDFIISGVQLGAHGDLGANGARGSTRSIESVYTNSITGHSHTPEILRGAWVVGTSSLLKLTYNRGPSSWLNTSCLLYSNGQRQLINIINGKWRL